MDYIRRQLNDLFKTNKKEYELVSQAEQLAGKEAVQRIYRRVTILGKKSAANTDPVIDPSLPAADTSQLRQDKLDDLLPRFGPIYRYEHKDPMELSKKKAWRRVKYSVLGGDGEAMKEEVVAAIRRIEDGARRAYDLDIAGAPSEFRMMMIKDGCFFLLLAFIILGKSEVKIGTYLKAESVLGRSISDEDIKQWMEAMFLVGNQIPVVVLNVLAKQKYFQDIIAQGKWDPPSSDLRKRALFNMMASVAQHDHFRKTDETVEPFDLLSGLKNLVLGAAPLDDKFGKYEGTPFDLEANTEEVITDDKERNFASATDLNKAGIGIKILESGGPRSVNFTKFYLNVLANLHLPALRVDEHTEIVFSTLSSYELSNKQLGKHNHEVRAYISFMSDLIQTPQDLSLLRKKGIIEGSPDHADKLLGVLRRLNSKEVTLTYKFRNIRREIRDFSSSLIRYQNIINFIVFLTFMQTFFTLLAYFKPPH